MAPIGPFYVPLQALEYCVSWKDRTCLSRCLSCSVCGVQHFPHRLHQLFLVDLPPQLRWVLATLKPLLHPQTKEKIHTISISDPALPLPASALQAPRLEGDAAEVSTADSRPMTPGLLQTFKSPSQ